jgi:hypothetical protein
MSLEYFDLHLALTAPRYAQCAHIEQPGDLKILNILKQDSLRETILHIGLSAC